MSWERARSEEQKEKRILEIVDATANLYLKMNYEEITFALIAKEAEFTRSNLYKYFKNKEEIFLEFIKYDLSGWRQDVYSALQGKKCNARNFAVLWVELILGHKRLIELFTILFTSIEKKSSLENLISFKGKIVAEIKLLAELLLGLFPEKAPSSVSEFIYAQFALAIGMYPLLNLSKNQVEAMKRTGFITAPDYYKKIFVKSIKILAEKMLYGVSGDNA